MIIGYFWCPISWEPRVLTNADKHIHCISKRTCHTHTHIYKHSPPTPTHTCTQKMLLSNLSSKKSPLDKHTENITCNGTHHMHAHTHTHTKPHTHSHALQKHKQERKQQINRQKRRGEFSVLTWKKRVRQHTWWRKEESFRWQVWYTERLSPQESSCTPLGHGKSKYLRLNEENEKEKRDIATQRGMEELYQRQCGSRWELFCIESDCWSAANGDQRVKEWCRQVLELCIWGKLSSWSLWILSRRTWGEPARRALQ